MDIKRLRILLGPFIISWAPIFFVWVGGMTGGSIAGWRFFLGGLALALFQLFRGRKIPALNPWMLVAAVAFALDIFLWHHSILSVGSGLATVLANTQVIYMSFISLRKKEFDRPLVVVSSAGIGFVGVVLLFYDRMFSPGSLNAPLPIFERIQGLIYGLAAGLCYTIFLLYFSKAQNFDPGSRRNRISALQALTWVSLIGGAGLLIFEASMAIAGQRQWIDLYPSTPRQVFLIFTLALVIHIGGWLELGNALNHFKKATMGLILLLQPVMATAWAWILFNERMNGLQLMGALLILIALIVIRLAETTKRVA